MARTLVPVAILLVIIGVGIYLGIHYGLVPGVGDPFAATLQVKQMPPQLGECPTKPGLVSDHRVSASEVLLGLPIYLELQGFEPKEAITVSLARGDATSPGVSQVDANRRYATMHADDCGGLAIEIMASDETHRGDWLTQAVGRESRQTTQIIRFAIR